jgi:hypothetical protein
VRRDSAIRFDLPDGWGVAFLYDAGHSDYPGQGSGRLSAQACPRSYDHTGRALVWHPERRADDDTLDARFACDIESRDRPMDESLAGLAREAWNPYEFWVLAEAAAKLNGRPILDWLQEYRKQGRNDWKTGLDLVLVSDNMLRISMSFGVRWNGAGPGRVQRFDLRGRAQEEHS